MYVIYSVLQTNVKSTTNIAYIIRACTHWTANSMNSAMSSTYHSGSARKACDGEAIGVLGPVDAADCS